MKNTFIRLKATIALSASALVLCNSIYGQTPIPL